MRAGPRWVLLPLFIALPALLSIATVAFASDQAMLEVNRLCGETTAPYAPHRVIAKFTPEAALNLMERSLRAMPVGLQATLHRARVRTVRPLLASAWPAQGAPIAAEDRIARVHARYPQRAARVPVDARPPDLENILLLELEEDVAPPYAAYVLSCDPDVVYAEPDWIATTSLIPDDPYFSSTGSWGQAYQDLWGLHKIGMEGAWDITTGDPNVIVAVVDTGLDYTHPDIAGQEWINTAEVPANSLDDDANGYVDDWRGWDFVGASVYTPTPDNDPLDHHGHGSHVSGTIAALTDNAIGIAGVCWEAQIMPVKGLDDYGRGNTSDLALAMIYAADNGADVMNNSWGGPGPSQLLQNTVDYCHAAGCIVVVAAGNSYSEMAGYVPAGLRDVVGVVATGPDDVKPSFSNYGDRADVSAPGVDILSLRAAGTSMGTPLTAEYTRANGTSMATPHVAGALALLISAHPTWTAAQLVAQLDGTGDNIDALNNSMFRGKLGLGRINVDRALTGAPSGQRIVLLSYQLSEATGDGDEDLESGERVQLVVALKHFTGTSTNVTVSLSSSDPYLTFVNGTVSLGNLTGWCSIDNQANPFTFDVSPGCPDLHRATIFVSINADGGAYQGHAYVQFFLNLYPPGWPLDQPTAIHPWSLQEPCLADLDDDGTPEIVAVTDGLHVFRGDATELPGFPVDVIGDIPQEWLRDCIPAVGDITGDGEPEIVCASSRRLYAWSAQGALLPGFPLLIKGSGDFPAAAVTLADLTGDAAREIIASCQTDAPTGKLRAYSGPGALLWEVDLGARIQHWGYFSCPAAADLDGDGHTETVVRTDYNNCRLYLVRDDGTVGTGWPVTLTIGGNASANIVLGDADDNGSGEIYVPTSWTGPKVFYPDGTAHPRWQDVPVTAFTLADVNLDGALEVLASGMPNIAYGSVCTKDGDVLARFRGSQFPGPTVADIDHDGRLEMISRDNGDTLYTAEWDDPPLGGYCGGENCSPLPVGHPPTDVWGLHVTTGIADINGDGKLEMIAGMSGSEPRMFVFRTPGGLAGDRIEYGQFAYTPERPAWITPTGPPTAHMLSLFPTATPAHFYPGLHISVTVSSGASDSHHHTVATAVWDDRGAGGSFVYPPTPQSPDCAWYYPPDNTTDDDLLINLDVTVTCSGTPSLTVSGSTSVLVAPVAHLFTVTAAPPNPSTVGSALVTSLGATCTDTRSGHSFSWSWDDGGAGGTFLPSTSYQNPIYVAPPNTTPGDLTVTLTVTATCDGPSPLSASDSTTLIVTPWIGAKNTMRVSLDSDEMEGNNASQEPAISSDGHYVAFASFATNLISDDHNNRYDIFLRDRVATTTERVNLGPGSVEANDHCGYYWPAISANGQIIAFWSYATNFLPPGQDANGSGDVFVRDRTTGTTTLVSVSTGGLQGIGDSSRPALSADGRLVVFQSFASLVTDDTNGKWDIYLRDRSLATTERVSVGLSGAQSNGTSTFPAISADGRFVAFTSDATNLVAGDINGKGDVFVYDRQTGLTALVSVSSSGAQGNGHSAFPAISADGIVVAFRSEADNLVSPGTDLNHTADTFVHERLLGNTVLVSANAAGNSGNGGCEGAWGPSISSSGRFVAFQSYASDLVPNDNNSKGDVFVRDVFTSHTERVSVSTSGDEGLEYSGDPAISADGRYVAFQSPSPNLVPDDTNNTNDVFVRDRQIFSDVPVFHWAFAPIQSCLTAGIVGGYADGTYRPSLTVTRDQMAVYVARALSGGEVNIPYQECSSPPFTDILCDNWARRYIQYVVGQAIAGGYPDGSYRPANPVDRGQMAVYVARAKGWVHLGDDMTTAPQLFSDVPAGFWAGTAVQACVENDVVHGYGDGTYRPAAAVTRDQMAVYICQAFGLP